MKILLKYNYMLTILSFLVFFDAKNSHAFEVNLPPFYQFKNVDIYVCEGIKIGHMIDGNELKKLGIFRAANPDCQLKRKQIDEYIFIARSLLSINPQVKICLKEEASDLFQLLLKSARAGNLNSIIKINQICSIENNISYRDELTQEFFGNEYENKKIGNTFLHRAYFEGHIVKKEYRSALVRALVAYSINPKLLSIKNRNNFLGKLIELENENGSIIEVVKEVCDQYHQLCDYNNGKKPINDLTKDFKRWSIISKEKLPVGGLVFDINNFVFFFRNNSIIAVPYTIKSKESE